MFKRILVPLDGSRFGSRALDYAYEVAHRFGAEIVLLQVVKPATPVPTTTGASPGIVSQSAVELAAQAALEEDKRNTTHAKRYLSGKARGIRSRDIKASYQVVAGDPAQSIISSAQKELADLIVMTTHGKSGLKRALMGSVADVVIRGSGKPVLVIRPQTKRKK
jgi:nucleotide-binding universal stress UspA family protein